MVTHEVALEYGLSGWVRNEADGSVLAVFEGSPAAVDGCLDAIQERMSSFLSGVTSPRFDDDHGYSGFEIRN